MDQLATDVTQGGEIEYMEDMKDFSNEISREHSNTVYQREDKVATLSDFEIKKVIGKGSFGKVFLVQHKLNMSVFAMKSLRKDVILEYDQLESTLLEKEIL